jgi:hypothetical protein
VAGSWWLSEDVAVWQHFRWQMVKRRCSSYNHLVVSRITTHEFVNRGMCPGDDDGLCGSVDDAEARS